MTTCSINQCYRRVYAKGFCAKHYKANRANQKPICPHCGKAFLPKRSDQRYCSGRHQNAAKQAEFRQRSRDRASVVAFAISELDALRDELLVTRNKAAGRVHLVRLILERAA